MAGKARPTEPMEGAKNGGQSPPYGTTEPMEGAKNGGQSPPYGTYEGAISGGQSPPYKSGQNGKHHPCRALASASGLWDTEAAGLFFKIEIERLLAEIGGWFAEALLFRRFNGGGCDVGADDLEHKIIDPDLAFSAEEDSEADVG